MARDTRDFTSRGDPELFFLVTSLFHREPYMDLVKTYSHLGLFSGGGGGLVSLHPSLDPPMVSTNDSNIDA